MFRIYGLLFSLYLNNIYFVIIGYLIATNLNSSNFKNTNVFNGLFIAFICIIILFIVFGMINIIYSIKCGLKREYKKLEKYMKILKLSSIPYFIINFICIGLFVVVLLAASRGFGIVYLPIPFILTWFVVVVTSSYGIVELIVLFGKKDISIKNFILYIILQLCFVIDIISTFWILKQIKNSEVQQNNKC
jgi:hypothetical protein